MSWRFDKQRRPLKQTGSDVNADSALLDLNKI